MALSKKPRTLLNTLQCTRQPPTIRNSPSQNINNDELKNPDLQGRPKSTIPLIYHFLQA